MPRRDASHEKCPTPAALAAAVGKRVPDLIGPGLRLLFCGINPSLYSAVVGHHFARPGNRFRPTLHRAGFTDRLLCPSEERELLARGIGITNVCSGASASADALSLADYASGGAALRRKLRRYRPRAIAFLGLGAYRIAARDPQARVGAQAQPFAGVVAWALPNPSGLNAHYTIDDLVECYRALAQAVMTRRAACSTVLKASAIAPRRIELDNPTGISASFALDDTRVRLDGKGRHRHRW